MMKKIIAPFAILVSCCTVTNTNAQDYRPAYLTVENQFISTNFDIVDFSGWLEAKYDKELTLEEFLANKQHFGLGDEDGFVLVRETGDNYPFIKEEDRITHSRYNQTHNGVKVEYAEIFLHHQNDKIKFINGKTAEGLSINVSPSLNENEAYDKAIDYLGTGNIYSWQDAEYEISHKEWKNDTDATSYPKGELLIAKLNLNQDYSNKEFVLAWKFNIISLSPAMSKAVYVDAHTGEIIKDLDLQSHGSGNLSYGYGSNVYLDTRYRGGLYSHYVARSDDANAPKIWTKKHHSTGAFGGYNCTWPYNIMGCTTNAFDQDDYWEDEVVATPHWLGTKAWNFWKVKFNRESYDNAGAEVRILNNMPQKQSSYDPNDDVLRFGRLDGANGGPHQATRDIFGHEFGHAVIRYTLANGNFNGANEPGALCESFSDIFGYELERYINGGHLNWSLGEDTQIRRWMNNPSQSVVYGAAEGCSDHNQSQPAFYKGPRWYFGSCDRGGVHINNGVQNYWYYLLSQGSVNAPEGTFNNISVGGIGSDKALNITFYSLDNILSSNSNFNDAKNGAILAAAILYGSCSNEVIQTTNAWAAVGLGTARLPLSISGPSFIGFSGSTGLPNSGYPINYYANGGNARQYVWSYSGNWSYSVLSPGFPWDNHFKITNFNNQFATSILSVSDRCTTVSRTIYFLNTDHIIEINPNPVISGTAQVRLKMPVVDDANPVIINIVDLQGNLKLNRTATTSELTIDLNALPNGNYVLHASQNELAGSIQFIKQ
ncbi:M4 family metallopeptidase [Edaphocola flava]|uniref:M4 family metallopeptidase n=1 Tax=Edaphocola flava TaxID=2499629 RepID=UPI00100BB3DB|nr:M4 family metallopeptidase [Edaphocola flava]